MPSIFVTSGATVAFTELISLTLSSTFLQAAADEGYDHITVQYGKTSQGKVVFTESLANLGISNPAKETHSYKGTTITGLDFSDSIDIIISSADLVISHAGTGSILDTLRLKKKLIVVVNDKLMDNHQQEVADELSEKRHLLKTGPTLIGLLDKLRISRLFDFSILPKPGTGVIETILHEL